VVNNGISDRYMQNALRKAKAYLASHPGERIRVEQEDYTEFGTVEEKSPLLVICTVIAFGGLALLFFGGIMGTAIVVTASFFLDMLEITREGRLLNLWEGLLHPVLLVWLYLWIPAVLVCLIGWGAFYIRSEVRKGFVQRGLPHRYSSPAILLPLISICTGFLGIAYVLSRYFRYGDPTERGGAVLILTVVVFVVIFVASTKAGVRSSKLRR